MSILNNPEARKNALCNPFWWLFIAALICFVVEGIALLAGHELSVVRRIGNICMGAGFVFEGVTGMNIGKEKLTTFERV